MSAGGNELTDRHRRALDGFGAVIEAGRDGDWTAPSPCTEWDAGGVVDHVIGFQAATLLAALDLPHEFTPTDPTERWPAARAALDAALAHPDLFEVEVDVPQMRTSSALRLLPSLTADVLVHTWDVARALGVDDRLDTELCSSVYEYALPNADLLRASKMFGDEVAVPADTDVQDRLLGLFGRDPNWRPPPPSPHHRPRS